PRPHNATAILETPAPGGAHHTSVLPPVEYGAPAAPAEEVLLLDRILHFATGRFVLVTLGVIASMVIGWAVWFQVAGQYEHVPKIIGMTKAEAVAALQADNIDYTYGATEYSEIPGVEKNDISAVEPGPGTKIKPGDKVTLTVSKGRRPVTLRNVANTTADEAEKALREQGFTKFERTFGADPANVIPKDKVIRTDPKAGTKVSPDETIKIVISQGPTMPDVTGRPKDDAKGWLESLAGLGLQVQIQEVDDTTKPAGKVFAQQPPAGTVLNPGDTVVLTVAKDNCHFGPIPLPWCGNNANNPDDGNADEHGNKRVPKIVGLSLADAQARLQQRGFVVNIQQGGGSGTVQRAQPAEGQRVPQGSVITLWD
ncbi:PASTA domain-containing protein, partial [Actinocorallia lasiicapitis]